MDIYAGVGVLILVLVSGCLGDTPPDSESRVSYLCPEKWTITEELEYEDIGYYSACEKQGTGLGSLFIMSWFEFERDLSEVVADTKSNLEVGYAKQGSGVSFSEPVESSFKDYPALTLDYAFSLSGVEYRGKVITFNCDNKNVVLLSQEAAIDHKENLADFRRIEDSFVCS